MRSIEVPEPIDRVILRRYPGTSLQRLRHLGARAAHAPEVWDEIRELGDQIQVVIHKQVALNLVPDLVAAEPGWNLTFFGCPFGNRLQQEWNDIPEAVRGKAIVDSSLLTIGPQVQAVIRRDQSDFASVCVPEMSFKLLFSGYPASMDSMDAMKALPTLQLVRRHLEPVLGPLAIEATWSL
jgi:hypothetical protein